jgi:UDP-glucose 4-epimerase
VLVAGRSPPPAYGAPIAFQPLDLATADWDALIADWAVIHHYAWDSVPETAHADPIADVELNVLPSLRLLEAARRRGGRRIIFASSGGTVYGRAARTPAHEDDPLRPTTAYGAAKLTVEAYLRVHHLAGRIDGRVARLANPYGLGQNPARRQGVVSTFVRQAVAGETLRIWGDGEVVRDYLHVSDAAEALLALALLDTHTLVDLPVVNIGSGRGHSLNAVVAVLQSVLGRSIAVERSAGRPFDASVNVLDIARARALLGWVPRLSLEQGVRLMIGDLATGVTRDSPSEKVEAG